MVAVIQLLGIGYILLMLYLTFLYYKRNNYSTRSFVFWMAVWSLGILLLAFPATLSVMTQTLSVPRVIDFYLIIGLMFFSIITFLNYATVKRQEKRIEDLVRTIALSKQQQPKRKK